MHFTLRQSGSKRADGGYQTSRRTARALRGSAPGGHNELNSTGQRPYTPTGHRMCTVEWAIRATLSANQVAGWETCCVAARDTASVLSGNEKGARECVGGTLQGHLSALQAHLGTAQSPSSSTGGEYQQVTRPTAANRWRPAVSFRWDHQTPARFILTKEWFDMTQTTSVNTVAMGSSYTHVPSSSTWGYRLRSIENRRDMIAIVYTLLIALAHSAPTGTRAGSLEFVTRASDILNWSMLRPDYRLRLDVALHVPSSPSYSLLFASSLHDGRPQNYRIPMRFLKGRIMPCEGHIENGSHLGGCSETACTARREDFGSPYGTLPGMVWYVQQRKRWSPYGALCAAPSDLHNHIALDATRGSLTHFLIYNGSPLLACPSVAVLFTPLRYSIGRGRPRIASTSRPRPGGFAGPHHSACSERYVLPNKTSTTLWAARSSRCNNPRPSTYPRYGLDGAQLGRLRECRGRGKRERKRERMLLIASQSRGRQSMIIRESVWRKHDSYQFDEDSRRS
jgi:hypothetical protein